MSLPSTLFHYTDSLETVYEIFDHGFWPRYSPENIEWLEYPGDKLLGIPMVCFCDIPVARIEFHSRIFGYYGLGMTRKWAESYEISPVHYVKRKGLVASLYQDLKTSSKDELRRLAAYVQNYEYISESEWRYVPDLDGVPGFVIDRTLDDEQRLAFFNNITREKAMLRFNVGDVDQILVARNADILELQQWLNVRFDSKIANHLVAKIRSFEASIS